MKCWNHPELDAVAFCKSCGKGVCRDCAVVVQGDSYCRTCVDSGRVVAVVPPVPNFAKGVPAPTGTPKRAFFVVGGIGCIVNSIAAIWFFFPTLAPTVAHPLSGIIGYILLVVGLILASVGYLGMRRNYGSGVGTASFAIGIVVAVLFILWSIWLSVEYATGYPYSQEWYLEFRTYIWITFYEIFFAMMILWAVTHITTRRFTGKFGFSLATGIMLIITAVFLETSNILWALTVPWQYDSYGSAFFEVANALNGAWCLLFFVGEILATVSFFTAKVPESPSSPAIN